MKKNNKILISRDLLMKMIEKNELKIRESGKNIYISEVLFLKSIGFSEKQAKKMVSLGFSKSSFFDTLMSNELHCQRVLESILARINLTHDYIKLDSKEFKILAHLN